MKGKHTLGRLISILSTSIFALGLIPIGIAQAENSATPGPAPEVCMGCHADKYETFMKSPHSAKGDPRSPASKGGCVACHGDGMAHVQAGGGRGVGGIINPISKNLTSDAKNGICLTCHKGGHRMNWEGSQHQAAGVACVNCHTMHQGKDKVRDNKTQPEVCFTCHKDKRTEILKQSHHPIKEGKVICSDCHNPHGSPGGPHNLVKATLNEVCYQCHADKRGPFLWEHPPAREECTNCHVPHGSLHAPLLKARAPWLCQECHSANSHPSTAYTGTGIPQNGATQQLLANSCMNCHPMVHGSNHPSGARFTR